MLIGVKGKQLCQINYFKLSKHCELDLRPFNPKITRAHPRLTGSPCIKFHDNKLKGKQLCNINYVQESKYCDLDLWHRNPKDIVSHHGESVWRFMKGVKGKQLFDINHFQLSMHCGLELWSFDLVINGAQPQLIGSFVWSFMIIGVKEKQLWHSPFSMINAMWPWLLTIWPQN